MFAVLWILFARYSFSEQLCRADVRSSASLSADVSLSAENERRHCASMLKFHRILVMPPSLLVGVVSAKCCISLSPGVGDLDDANQWIYAPEAAVLVVRNGVNALAGRAQGETELLAEQRTLADLREPDLRDGEL